MTKTAVHQTDSEMWWWEHSSLGVFCLLCTRETYRSILQRHAIPSGLCLRGVGFVLLYKNDPKHTSKLYKNYLKNEEDQGVLTVT